MVDGVRIFWKDETGILRDTTDVVNGLRHQSYLSGPL